MRPRETPVVIGQVVATLVATLTATTLSCSFSPEVGAPQKKAICLPVTPPSYGAYGAYGAPAQSAPADAGCVEGGMGDAGGNTVYP